MDASVSVLLIQKQLGSHTVSRMQSHLVVNLSERAAPSARRKHRTGEWTSLLQQAPLLALLWDGFDLIMASDWLDFGEQLPGLWLKYGIVYSGPAKDRTAESRVKHVHLGTFDLIVALLSQDISASIAIALLQGRKHPLSEQLLVGIRVLS